MSYNRIWAFATLLLLSLMTDAFAAEYIGGAACTECHVQQTKAWQGSHHDLAMQEANTATVLGDFNDAVLVQFGVGKDLIEAYFHPYIYLDRKLIQKKGLDQGEVEQAVATQLKKLAGVADAVSSTALRIEHLPDNQMTRSIRHNFNSRRSGDIYLVFDPDVFVNDFDRLVVASSHGSPWSYDTYVPVIFAGSGLKPKKIGRPITPYDVAPTLAGFLNVKSPSGAIGVPLVEVLDK